MDNHGNLLPENYSFFVPDDSPYINSDGIADDWNGVDGNIGDVDVSISHTMAGTPSGHDMQGEVVALYQ